MQRVCANRDAGKERSLLLHGGHFLAREILSPFRMQGPVVDFQSLASTFLRAL